MSIVETLDKINHFLKRNSTFDLVLGKGFRERVAHWREISRNGDLEAVDGAQAKLIEYYDRLSQGKVQQEDIFPNFKGLLQDRDIQLSFNRYAQHMETKLLHAERLGLIFNGSAYKTPENKIPDLIQAIQKSSVMMAAADVDESKLTNVKGAGGVVTSAFLDLAERCPSDFKQDFIYAVDELPYFKACMVNGVASAQAANYKEMMSHLGDEDALRFMKFSDTWLSIPKTSNLRNWLYEYDERLMPAMDYSK